jgi:hypothetical protein
MRVRFLTEVLESESAWNLLDGIVDVFIEERHLWDVDDVEAIERSQWLAEEGRHTRRSLEALEKCVTQSAYSSLPHRHRLSVTVALQTALPTKLSPEDARRCLTTAAAVIVEDGESDGAFIEAMLDAWKHDELKEARKKGWWKIVHAGGGPAQIERRIRELCKEMVGMRRILVVADSDRLFPGHESSQVRDLNELRVRYDVQTFILHKREMENYLPVGALQRRKQWEGTYRAFLNLTREQQDHYDMKKGFRDKTGQADLLPEQVELFRHVSPRILHALCGGFGDHVWKLFDRARDVITRDAMRPTCGTEPDEIDHLLQVIEGLL